MSSINYLGFIREFRVDYEYIVLSKQGQIIMYSKSLYDKLIKDHKYYDSSNNYIHFLCKEYLDELEHVYDIDYEISHLSLKDSKLEKYGFFLLHFGLNKQIEDHLKSDKKNNKNLQQNKEDNQLQYTIKSTGIPQMLMRLISKREEIKRQ